jgi:hypothetical protein
MSTVRPDGALRSGGPSRPARRPARDLAPIALVDLLDRLLGSGVVVAGDVVVSLAGVDLVEIRLHLMISAVRAEMARDRAAAT